MDLFLYEKELPFDTRTTGSFAIFTRSVCFESAIPGEAGGWAELGEWNEEADSYAVRFAVRGCKEEDIKVEEKGGLLKLLAKRVEVVERVVRHIASLGVGNHGIPTIVAGECKCIAIYKAYTKFLEYLLLMLLLP